MKMVLTGFMNIFEADKDEVLKKSVEVYGGTKSTQASSHKAPVQSLVAREKPEQGCEKPEQE